MICLLVVCLFSFWIEFMLNGFFLFWLSYSEEEVDVVCWVLFFNWVNYWIGEEGCYFECEFVVFIGIEYVVVVVNGILVLDFVLCGLDIGSGDEVIVFLCIYFVIVSVVVNVGVWLVFVDVDWEF